VRWERGDVPGLEEEELEDELELEDEVEEEGGGKGELELDELKEPPEGESDEGGGK
jgi:hypothetical protein